VHPTDRYDDDYERNNRIHKRQGAVAGLALVAIGNGLLLDCSQPSSSHQGGKRHVPQDRHSRTVASHR
jgi:hypothetical protein